VRHQYDPDVEIDWEAMTGQQRITLTRYEVACAASASPTSAGARSCSVG
jgi:hypothetical protein